MGCITLVLGISGSAIVIADFVLACSLTSTLHTDAKLRRLQDLILQRMDTSRVTDARKAAPVWFRIGNSWLDLEPEVLPAIEAIPKGEVGAFELTKAPDPDLFPR